MDKASFDKNLKKLISNKLKQIYNFRSLTLEGMADEIGIEYSALYKIYKGESLPRLSTLYTICQVYDLTIDALFQETTKSDKDNDFQQKIEEADFIQTYRKLDTETKRVILNLMKGYTQRRKHSIR